MKKHIDAHCHVFNKDVLSIGINIVLRSLKIGEIARFLDKTHLDKLLKKIENLIHFIDIGLNNNTEGIYDEMQVVYKNDYIVTPLMLDLTYVSGQMKTNLHKSIKGEKHERIHHHLQNAIADYSKSVKLQVQNSSEKEKVHGKLANLENRMLDLKKKIEQFAKEKENLRLFGKKNFQKQFNHLSTLKKNHLGMVYPFLSADPRQPNILQIVKDNVGANKTFIGVKLYAPTGYSPTDPLLYGTGDTYSDKEDCLYNYCMKNDIPITAHCSDSGFATFNNTAKVKGYIYTADKDKIEYKDGIIVFKKKIDLLKFRVDSGAIEERAMILNHPKIWHQVLTKFNTLRLNLAHFGGGGQLNNFIDYRNGEKPDYETYSWAKTIFELLENKKFTKFYTDLSCFKEDSNITLTKFKENLYDPNAFVKSNTLYGSDFYLNMIFTDSFDDYVNMFTSDFGSDYDQISILNNMKFLKNLN